jgi:hypothetical protein
MSEIATTRAYGNYASRIKYDGSITWIALDEEDGDPEEIIRKHLRTIKARNEDVEPFGRMERSWTAHSPHFYVEYGPTHEEDWAHDAIVIRMYVDGRTVITKSW